MKSLLITGASGFIGKNLTEAFRGRYELIIPGRFELDLGNMTIAKEYLMRHEADVLIHCANSSDTNHHIAPKKNFISENLRMFFALDSLRQYYGKMIYFGSGAEYGQLHYIPQMNEDYFGCHIPETDDVYGLAKYVMGKYSELSHGVINLRLFGIFGKYEMWSRRFISNTICKALKGIPIIIDQNKLFDYMWAADLAPIVEWFIENEPKHNQYNVCTGNRIDLLTIARIVCNVVGIPQNIEVKSENGTEYSGDNSRLVSELGNVKFTDMKTAINELTRYYESCINEFDENQL